MFLTRFRYLGSYWSNSTSYSKNKHLSFTLTSQAALKIWMEKLKLYFIFSKTESKGKSTSTEYSPTLITKQGYSQPWFPLPLFCRNFCLRAYHRFRIALFLSHAVHTLLSENSIGEFSLIKTDSALVLLFGCWYQNHSLAWQ